MNKNEVEVGKVYWAKHNGQECRVRLDSIDENKIKYGLGLYGTGRTVTRYRCTKLSTGNAIVFKSAKKFIKEATTADNMPPEGNYAVGSAVVTIYAADGGPAKATVEVDDLKKL